MLDNNILFETKAIIASVLQLSVEQLDIDDEMTDIEEWDSLRNVMILSQLEEHFSIVFPPDDIFDLTSIKAFAEEIQKLKG
ncbi:MAG: acyl carrier protein [Bacteroidales bacterium]|nr:acyl carrier protein [Bacteroidales bacterium]